MRITILTVGSRGDVQPYIALGLGLQQAGHSVTVATHEIYREFVSEHGLGFRKLEGNPQELMVTEAGQDWLATGRNPFTFLRQMASMANDLMTDIMVDALDACRDADAVIFTAITYLAYSAIEKLGLPSIGAYLQPINPTREFTFSTFPPAPTLLPMKGAYNRFSYLFAMEASWRLFREPIDRVRAEVLDLPPLTVPYRKLVNQPIPILYGYSTHVLPRPKDWHDHLHLTGYWFLDNDLDWQPPAELVDFLDDGPPPVYIGFGSMSGGDAERLADVSLKALQSAGQRGILLTGWGGLDKSDLPDTVLKLAAAPHQWLFPRMSGVVHHGGAGTVSAGLRAGVPSLAIPFFADQPFWGAQLFKLGVGPAPISRKRLTANRLGYALRRMADHEGMRQRAADIGARIRAEDGVGEAVRLFEHYIGQ